MTDSKELPANKRAKLVTDTAALTRAYVAAGKTFEDAITHAIAAHKALRIAIDPESKFMHTFAHQIEAELAKLVPSPDYAMPHDESMRTARNILTNRVREEEQMIKLLADPKFLEEVKSAHPSHGSNALPAGKVKEIAGRLVQETDPNGPEGATHVAAGALGQRLMHEALACAYAPNGALTGPLIEGLKANLPNASPEELLTIANGWLHDRFHPARAVADAMRYDGEAYQMAAKRADELQNGPAKTTPPTQIAGPVTNEPVKLKDAPQDILLDNI
jgi:hypothetical protein